MLPSAAAYLKPARSAETSSPNCHQQPGSDDGGSEHQRQHRRQHVLDAEATLRALQLQCHDLERDNALMRAKEQVYTHGARSGMHGRCGACMGFILPSHLSHPHSIPPLGQCVHQPLPHVCLQAADDVAVHDEPSVPPSSLPIHAGTHVAEDVLRLVAVHESSLSRYAVGLQHMQRRQQVRGSTEKRKQRRECFMGFDGHLNPAPPRGLKG